MAKALWPPWAPACEDFKVGDKVYGAGAYAEYVAVRSEYLAHVPKGISFTEAGALAISARVRR